MAQVYRNHTAVATRWAAMVAGTGATAADVGTGAGHLAVALAERGIRVAAIDASEAMRASVAQNASTAGVADLVTPMFNGLGWLQRRTILLSPLACCPG